MNIFYQKITSHDGEWWCLAHKRIANHIRIREHDIKVHCDPKLSGIMIPCDCKKLIATTCEIP